MWEPTWEVSEHSLKYYHFNPRLPCGNRQWKTSHSLPQFGFQSTAPVWEPTGEVVSEWWKSRFQSTAPVWEPTLVSLYLTLAIMISIHGSRVGTDSPAFKLLYIRSVFQSTAPVWEPTNRCPKFGRRYFISIHGSRVGTDNFLESFWILGKNFNPRLPCGNRHKKCVKKELPKQFQSTAPVWEPTIWEYAKNNSYRFQSTAPVWEPTYRR